MPTLHFDADLSQWLRAFANIDARIADATPAHEKIGDLLIEESRANFESEGGAAKWKELQPATLARTPRPGNKPLLVTRELFRSMTKDVQRGHVDVGSSLPYARAQFYGRKFKSKRTRDTAGRFSGSTGGGEIPARPPFSWRAGVMARVAELYIKHFFGALR